MKNIMLMASLFVSVASFAQISGTSFEEPPIFDVQYVDTGDATTAHDLVNNPDEPNVNYASTGGEIGFNARYEPYDTPGDGLTDGDAVGVTDSNPTTDDPYTDGEQGYQISDSDGNFILEFDQIDLTGVTDPTLTLDYFIAESGYEGDGTGNESGSDRLRIYIKDISTGTEIDILDTTGSNINELGIEGAWITGSAPVLTNTTVQLVIEARINAGTEEFFFDNVQVGGTLGISDNRDNPFSMYPNPASNGFVNIVSKTNGNKQVAVFDILGKQVINTTITGERLNIAKLNSGVYIVKINQGNASVTKKLVVK